MRLDEFQGVNAGYVLELYERYRQNPESVDPETRKAFESWTPPSTDCASTQPVSGDTNIQKIVGAANLADCIRRYGHLAARIDPLGSEPIGDPSLSPAAHGITEDDLQAAAGVARRRPGRGVVGQRLRGDRKAPSHLLLDASASTTRTSSCPKSASGCGTRRSRAASCRRWIATQRRGGARSHHAGRGLRALPAPDVPRQDALLRRRARHARADPRRDHLRRRPTTARATRCSAWRIAAASTCSRTCSTSRYAQILAEFKDPIGDAAVPHRPRLDGRREVPRRRPHAPRRAGQMYVSMAPNPSHLEAVDPGRGRHGARRGHDASIGRARRGSTARVTLPILIHGDAAFPGQGVVAETLNLSRLRRLRHRRHHSHHRQQPARVHGHARRVVQHQLRERPGARLQDPDRPRQRRRSGRLPRGGAAGVGISRARSASTS